MCEEMIHHHHCQHACYVADLNATEAEQEQAIQDGDSTAMLALSPIIAFNGGGHINHTLFWKSFTPEDSKPSPCLVGAINKSFGSFERMQKEMACACQQLKGSGWGWLGFHPRTRKLVVTSTPNEDPLESTTKIIPVLGFDMWEHSYYLQYKNSRDRYVDALFDIVNWEEVTLRYQEALGQTKKTTCQNSNPK